MSNKPQETPPSKAVALNLGRCMTSEIFELVAEDDVRFFVNEAILASQSKPFREAMMGPWREATERRIILTDWDSDTVARLVEFLYIGDYPYPDPSPLKPVPEPAGGNPESSLPEADDLESELDSSRPLTPLGECLQKCLAPDQNDAITDAQRLEKFNPADYDFGDVLLAHAKVYALANYKSVNSLRTLALKRLLLLLTRLHPIQPASHISMNVVDLASYVYSNTDPLSRTQEPLRKLTTQFIALNLAAFQTEPRAVQLVANGGDFVIDLMSKICRRLPDPEGIFWTGSSPKKGFISNVKAVYGTSAAPPSDRVTEVHNLTCNLSYPYSDPYTIWLVPEYTPTASNACTKFEVSTSGQGLSLDRVNNQQCYLTGVKEGTVMEKITEVALIRSPNITLDLKLLKSFDGISSGDMRNIGTNEPLYLLWKTVKTRRM